MDVCVNEKKILFKAIAGHHRHFKGNFISPSQNRGGNSEGICTVAKVDNRFEIN